MVKNPPANTLDMGSIPGSRISPGEGNGNSTPVFLSAKSHGQRSLEGYSPWGCKKVRHDLTTKQQQIDIDIGIYIYICIYMYIYRKRERLKCIYLNTYLFFSAYANQSPGDSSKEAGMLE